MSAALYCDSFVCQMWGAMVMAWEFIWRRGGRGGRMIRLIRGESEVEASSSNAADENRHDQVCWTIGLNFWNFQPGQASNWEGVQRISCSLHVVHCHGGLREGIMLQALFQGRPIVKKLIKTLVSGTTPAFFVAGGWGTAIAAGDVTPPAGTATQPTMPPATQPTTQPTTQPNPPMSPDVPQRISGIRQ